MRALTLFSLPFALTLVACGTVQMDPDVTVQEQIESGEVVMPTAQNPISLGNDGIAYIYPTVADEGLASPVSFYGVCVGQACQWNPEKGNGLPYMTYTRDGVTVLYTQFRLGVQGRGGIAQPGSALVDWSSDDSNSEEDGLADGWGNLPWEGDYITVVTDCGKMHPNFFFGWDSDGNIDLPEDPGSLGEDACWE